MDNFGFDNNIDEGKDNKADSTENISYNNSAETGSENDTQKYNPFTGDTFSGNTQSNTQNNAQNNNTDNTQGNAFSGNQNNAGSYSYGSRSNASFMNNGNTSGESNDQFKSPHYYTENYKKKKKGTNLWQVISVALVSSILGGIVVGSFLLFIAPSVPAFNKLLPNQTIVSNNDGNSVVQYKIEKSDSQVSAIAEKSSPSIVGIRVTAVRQDFFFQNSVQPSEGSGIIIKNDGYILTNNHVIADAIDAQTGKISDNAKIEVMLPNKKDKPYTAEVIGRDARTDIAVIKINATGLPVAELGNSDDVKVGEMAVAIGNPGGLEFMGSVTVGVISGVNRTVMIDENRELKVIQTDASINPGNSGGALLNSQGKVIGINTLKAQTQLGYEGIGFAVPINEAKAIADSLMSSGYVKGRPKLGVMIDTSFTEDIAKQSNVPAGLLVQDVTPFSAAYKAGIQRGDIITSFDGKQVKTFAELEEIKNSHKPGDIVDIEVYRYDDEKTLKLKLTIGEDTSGN